MRRSSRSLLDNLEEIAEEQEASESRDADFIYGQMRRSPNDDDDDHDDDDDDDHDDYMVMEEVDEEDDEDDDDDDDMDVLEDDDIDYGYEQDPYQDLDDEEVKPGLLDPLYEEGSIAPPSVAGGRGSVGGGGGDTSSDASFALTGGASNSSLLLTSSGHHQQQPHRRSFVSHSNLLGVPGGGGAALSSQHLQGSEASLDYSYGSSGFPSPVRSSKRRNQILVRPSLTGSTGDSSTEGGGGGGHYSSMMDSSSIIARTGGLLPHAQRSVRRTFGGRRSTKRTSSHHSRDSLSNPNSCTSTVDDSFSAAVDRLGSADHNSEWENVAAAAAVVAASTQVPAKRSHIQFGQGDYVLVLLTLLNVMNTETEPDLFTIDPVNALGYPAGEGQSETERQGPYSRVLCQVQTVHFDEDERYYTVRRMDTLTEQRADPGWMEPLITASAAAKQRQQRQQQQQQNTSKDQQPPENPTVLERALLAARRTKRSMAQQAAPKPEPVPAWWLAVTWPARMLQNHMIPWYQQTRASVKQLTHEVLHGQDGYVMRVRCTCINGLVLCSLIFLFLEIVALAFLPADLDNIVSIIATVAWAVLVLELIFEFLIRPSSYREIIRSDKAYAPATARHINTFHLISETLALLLFLPSTGCALHHNIGHGSILLSKTLAAMQAVRGVDAWKGAWARFSLGLTFLRCFGLLRHWKQMWIVHSYKGMDSENMFIKKLLLADHDNGKALKRLLNRKKRDEDDTDTTANDDEDESDRKSSEDDLQLKNAATIGTALMLVNSHRALFFLLLVVTLFPLVKTFGRQNPVGPASVDLLQANNIAANTSDDCDYLQTAVWSWLRAASEIDAQYHVDGGDYNVFLVWAELQPVRCSWQTGPVITSCTSAMNGSADACEAWEEIGNAVTLPEDATPSYFADKLGVRSGELLELERRSPVTADGPFGVEDFYVRAIYNNSTPVALANTSLFLLLLSLLMLSLVGLSVMRGDAGRLVLGPLRRMLKIVVKYADDPLSQSASKTQQKGDEVAKQELGNYETEQLINAIAKIADLLRKCWGIAGAGIISSNLARTQDGQTVVFNPTVPGKRVYALFGFVAINDFSKQLRVLDRDVMRLINDVANVVHDEVYRWSLGDSGQCNKNLGAAFLMVFRIGDFTEVHDKKKRATDVVFNSQMKKNLKVRRRQSNAKRRASSRHFDIGKDGTLQLASLPGIQAFSDRALLGMLKSFAGIHRDKELKEWQNDFRLGAGVGAFKVNVIYGMDAGWAVEGAVGSEYKIDATYLSPHVNMASRMMSACKQYGVTVLLSQAVEELLSRQARSKLRHLDTVYVKGSSVPQRIYTYDARFDGADFFLFERSPEQADVEAENYSPAIWESDQDLRSMRQHVTDEFMTVFHDGVEKYLDGKWKEAAALLQDADDLMLRAVIEEGYVDYKADDLGGALFDRNASCDDDEVLRIRNEFGDGACRCLLQYMQRRKCIPPNDWHGVRTLMSK